VLSRCNNRLLIRLQVNQTELQVHPPVVVPGGFYYFWRKKQRADEGWYCHQGKGSIKNIDYHVLGPYCGKEQANNIDINVHAAELIAEKVA